MNKYKAILSAFVTGVALFSCQNDGSDFENQMFIDGDSYKNEVRVATDENMSEMTKTMTVSIAQPLDYDVEVSVVKSPELLETYRQAYYDEKAELLPEKYCDISSVVFNRKLCAESITAFVLAFRDGYCCDIALFVCVYSYLP